MEGPCPQCEASDPEESESQRELITALARQRGFTQQAIVAVLWARRLLLLAVTAMLIKLGEADDLVGALYSQLAEKDVRIQQLERAIALLQARMERIDSRHRNRYTPAERFGIVLFKQTYSLTAEQAARLFVVSSQTINRWVDQAVREPGKNTIGSLLKAVPPLMRYSDVVRDAVTQMEEMGFGGSLRIAQTLARAGIRLSRETVRRWRKEPRPPRPPIHPKRRLGPMLAAKHPNHIWMLDITEITGLFGLFRFKLAVVMDVFSRMPVAGKVFTSEPSADEMSGLVRYAAARQGAPKHFVSDQGAQFTSSLLRATLTALGIKQRFGAIGATGSIAIIERFWRTLKEMLRLKVRPPLTASALHQRLQTGLHYYAYLKPHQGLGGATPAEMYYRIPPARQQATRPPRAYENKPDNTLFEIAYLDPEGFLPVLTPKNQAA
jgi:transposase InsO family protein